MDCEHGLWNVFQLQVAFSTGLLKPGLNVETAAPQTFANNVVSCRLVVQLQFHTCNAVPHCAESRRHISIVCD